MKKQQYEDDLLKCKDSRQAYILLQNAQIDKDISKKDYIELATKIGKVQVELVKQRACLTKKQLYIKELEEARASTVIMKILQRVNSDNLELQEVIDIQYVAIAQLKDMIVRY